LPQAKRALPPARPSLCVNGVPADDTLADIEIGEISVAPKLSDIRC
jgi:hypothetical protein